MQLAPAKFWYSPATLPLHVPDSVTQIVSVPWSTSTGVETIGPDGFVQPPEQKQLVSTFADTGQVEGTSARTAKGEDARHSAATMASRPGARALGAIEAAGCAARARYRRKERCQLRNRFGEAEQFSAATPLEQELYLRCDAAMLAKLCDRVLASFISLLHQCRPKTVLDRDLYLSGFFRPVQGEEPLPQKLAVQSGALPAALSGAFVRLALDSHFAPAGQHHLFDSDGLVRASSLLRWQEACRRQF